MVVTVSQGREAVAAVEGSVNIKLSTSEAKKLRRVMYYNKTVSSKFSNNPNGGWRKSQDIDAFMKDLGTQLKSGGITRF